MRIFVLDDDVELTALLKEFLQREGFEVELAHNGRTGLEQLLRTTCDLVVLDVMLPGIDGFEVLRRLRQSTRLPVVMLTARGEDVDRIVGLELGADDYVPTSFTPRELFARIRAVLRRTQPRAEAGRIEVNGVSLDPGTREVQCNGRRVDLTTVEFDILE